MTHLKKLFLAIIVLLVASLAYLLAFKPANTLKTFELVSLETAKGAEQTPCLVSQTDYKPFYSHTKHFSNYVPILKPESIHKKLNECQQAYANAVKNDELTESALYKNKINDFFDRAKIDQSNPLAPEYYLVDTQRLPAPLKAQLSQFKTTRYQTLKAFDIALASSRKTEILAFMPDSTEILPHQRRALFHLGLNNTLAQAQSTTDESLQQEQLSAYQSQMGVALQLGSTEIASIALNSLLYQAGQANQEQDYRGGYTSYDYLVANRYCDLTYAQFLTSKKIPLSSVHLLNLISALGQAQYSGYQLSNGRMFNYASADQVLPNATTLPQCKALVRLYSQHTIDFNLESLNFSDGYSYQNIYDELFKSARDAVFLWWQREDENKYLHQPVSNTLAIGNVALIPEAVAEVMSAQPASFEQTCAWAKYAYTWTHLLSQENANLVSALNALPKKWAKTETWFKHTNSVCQLTFNITDDYETQDSGAAFLNKTLTQYQIPCKSERSNSNELYELVCTIKTQPWPNSESPDPLAINTSNEN